MALLLVLLLGVAVSHGQDLPRPEINHVGHSSTTLPSQAMVIWDALPEAVSYEIFIRGFHDDDWRPSKKGGKGGWYPADAIDYHIFTSLMPGNRYNFRIRYTDAQGNISEMSRMFKIHMTPCWAVERALQTDERWDPKRGPVQPPPEWAGIPNTINCE